MKKIICIVGLLLWTNISAFEIPSVTSRGLGKSISLSQPDVSGYLNSALSFDTTRYGIELGYVRNYNLSDFDEFYVGGFQRFDRFIFGVAYAQFGNTDLYHEMYLRMTFGYTLNNLFFGVTGSSIRYEFNSEFEQLSANNFGFSVGYKNRYFALGALFDDLEKPKLTIFTDRLEKKTQFFFELFSHTSYHTNIKYELFRLYDNRFSLGEEIKISDNFTILFGFRTDPMTVSGGIKLKLAKQLLTYSVEHHPVLGYSYGISFTFAQ